MSEMESAPRVKGFAWRTLAVVSLMINLLIVGAAIGFVASGGFMRRAAMGPETRPGAVLRSLPPEQRRELMRDLVGAWRDTGEERRAAMRARAAMMEVARAEPFDEQKMRAAFAAMRGADQTVLARYHESLLTTLSKLSAEQRVAALRAAGGRPGLGRGAPPRPDAAGREDPRP